MKKKEILTIFILILLGTVGFRANIVRESDATSIYRIPQYFLRIRVKKTTPAIAGLKVEVVREEKNDDGLKITNNTGASVYLKDYHQGSERDQYLITPKEGVLVLSGDEWKRYGFGKEPFKNFFLIPGRTIGLYSPEEYKKYYWEEDPRVIVPWEVLGRTRETPFSIQGTYFYEANPDIPSDGEPSRVEPPDISPVIPSSFFQMLALVLFISGLGFIVGVRRRSLVIKIIFLGIGGLYLTLVVSVLLFGFRLPAALIDFKVFILRFFVIIGQILTSLVK